MFLRRVASASLFAAAPVHNSKFEVSAAWAFEKVLGKFPRLYAAEAEGSTVIINKVPDWIIVGTVKDTKMLLPEAQMHL